MKVLELQQFHLWKNKAKERKKEDDPLSFLLTDFVEACLIKGSYFVKYRTDFSGEEKELNFLKQNVFKEKPDVISYRGISSEKKRKIVADLAPLMPKNRRTFWETLPKSEVAADPLTSENMGDFMESY